MYIFYYLFKIHILFLNNGFINFGKNYTVMQEASFSGLFKTIMWVIAFYYIFKFLARIFLPVLVKKAVEKAGENFQRQQQYSQGNNWKHTRNNDEIIIDTANAKKPRETKKVGDYVDYEEID
jgi:DNA integrity scanning protein DisA with diadenylate cyclase activity